MSRHRDEATLSDNKISQSGAITLRHDSLRTGNRWPECTWTSNMRDQCASSAMPPKRRARVISPLAVHRRTAWRLRPHDALSVALTTWRHCALAVKKPRRPAASDLLEAAHRRQPHHAWRDSHADDAPTLTWRNLPDGRPPLDAV